MVRVIKNSVFSILLLSICFSASAAEKQKKVVLLREGFQLKYVKGVISTNAQGKWVFSADTPLNDKLNTLKAQSPIEILPSSILEKLTADIDVKDSRKTKKIDLQLQANVLKYRGKNYLFAMSYIPISKTQKPETSPTTEKTQTPKPKQAKAPKGDPVLSDDVKKLLNPDWAPDLKQKKNMSKVNVEDDFSMPSRTGFFVVKNKKTSFKLNSLGRKVDRSAYKMLPCTALELAEKAKHTMPGRKRYVVSGIATTYKGQKYLLPQRIVRTYNHGNFAR